MTSPTETGAGWQCDNTILALIEASLNDVSMVGLVTSLNSPGVTQ